MIRVFFLTALAALVGGGASPRPPVPVALPNDNRVTAGTLEGGILRVTLEARRAMWHPNGDSLPGLEVETFGEPGKAPQAPGPLIRIQAGTEVRVTVRNTLEGDTLNFFVPTALRQGGAGPLDSVTVLPGATGELVFTPTIQGNFSYRATLGRQTDRILRMSGLLAGALVVDSAGSTALPRDRVFVLMLAVDGIRFDADGNPVFGRFNFGINGRSWPHTERLTATVGDTLRWRIVNANFDVHPMHLHGFYFRVDSLIQPPQFAQGPPNRMVVTERMVGFSTMSMSWVPERAGNWLFHCHWSVHIAVPARDRGAPAPPHHNHATHGMTGLVMAIEVSPRPGERVAEAPPRPRRQLRLVAIQDSVFPDSAPSLRFRIEERGRSRRVTEAGPGFSPPLELVRGEPVSITVVNRLREPTAVHWHGIELESFFDGVADFSGAGRRLAPVIAPADSFEVRFTPPRAGTFIYHSHVDEPRQHRGGLVGALIVREPGANDVASDRIVFLKSSRVRGAPAPIEIGGQAIPDTMVLRAGRPYRFRLIGLTTLNPNPTVSITAWADSSFRNFRDTLIGQWRPLAKDGADLPEAQRTPRLARQIVGMGETYDFEFTPKERGSLRLEVRAAGTNGRLFNRVPIRVE